MIKVNGVLIPTPSTLQIDISDIDGETYRNAKGEMIRDRIATKRKLNMTWNALTPKEMITLLGAVADEFFTVEYPEPATGTTATKKMYVGDRNAPMYRNINGNILWSGLTMNFIEK